MEQYITEKGGNSHKMRVVGGGTEQYCFRKTGHPRNKTEGQGWEQTTKADTLNIFDNTENRTPILIVRHTE